jgi:hypothetical protein
MINYRTMGGYEKSPYKGDVEMDITHKNLQENSF